MRVVSIVLVVIAFLIVAVVKGTEVQATCGPTVSTPLVIKAADRAKQSGKWLKDLVDGDITNMDVVRAVQGGMHFFTVLLDTFRAGFDGSDEPKILTGWRKDTDRAQRDALEGCATQSGSDDEAEDCGTTNGPPVDSISLRQSWTAEQLGIAKTAQKVADDMDIPDRGLVVIFAAGFQESGVRNLTYGDGSSVGWLQLISSNGSYAQRMDPAYSARWFFRRLVKIHGWQHLPVTQAAQRVQVSAYPNAYAKWEDDARALLASLGQSCTPPAWDTLNTRTVNQAVLYLEGMARAQTPIEQRKCLHYVGVAYGRNWTVADSAYEQWTMVEQKDKHTGKNPPRGALMYWGPSPGNPSGHIAVSLGNGRAASTDWPAAGRIGIGPTEDLIGWPRGSYLGWTLPIFPGQGV